MPLDASIILGVKPPHFDTPLESQAKQATFDKLIGEQEMQKMQLQSARQAQADDTATREAYRQGGSESEIFNRLLQASPKAAMDYRKQLDESRGRQAQTSLHTAQAAEHQLKTQLDRISRVSSILSTARDQASYDAGRRMISAEFGPEAVANLPAQFDPADVQARLAAGLTYAQQLEAKHKADTLAQTQATAPFTAGPNGPVPNVPAQEYERSLRPGTAPHYDAERGIVVDPRTGQGTPVTVGGQPLAPKPNAATQKELMTIGQQEATVDGALAAVKETPSAFGRMRGAATMMGPVTESVVGGFDSKDEREARSYVFNIVSKVINERAGAAQSKQELARLRSFLPGEMDTAEQITDKLNAFKTYLGDLRKGTTAGTPPVPGASPAPGAPINATGTGPTLRAGGQAAAAEDAAKIRAQQPPEKIAADIASVEGELKRKGLNGTQQGILQDELRVLKRARELQAGGGATARTVGTAGAAGGWQIKALP